MESRIGLRYFLKLVEGEAVDRFEILDYIEEATNNHQPYRLQALLNEVENYIEIRRQELEVKHADKILDALMQWGDPRENEPPRRVLTSPTGEQLSIIDTDQLLNGTFSKALEPLYQLKQDILSILKASMLNATPEQEQASQVVALQPTPALQGLVASPNAEFGFYYHLTEDGKKVFPIVKELYSKVKLKKEYAIMLVVLNELGYLMNKHFTNKEQLISALKITFGDIIGSRQNLFTYVERYSDAPGPAELEELKRHKQRLLDAINKASQQSFANNT